MKTPGYKESPAVIYVRLAAIVSLLLASPVEAQEDRLFGPRTPLGTSFTEAYDVQAADLDGDGDVDILAAGDGSTSIAWFENDGTGAFGDARPISSPTSTSVHSVVATDLDDDGDLDVLSASRGDDGIVWYVNNGTGLFSGQNVISQEILNAGDVFAADVDGDGDPDVVAGSTGDDRITWYENDGAGLFGEQRLVAAAPGLVSIYPADLDDDGDMDIVAGSEYTATEPPYNFMYKVGWYENDGAGAFSEEHVIELRSGYAPTVHVADLDGDGDRDILYAFTIWNRIAWFANDGSGSFSDSMLLSDEADGVSGLATADLDGDGDQDVLSASPVDGKVAWYPNDGNGQFGIQHILSQDGSRPRSVSAADLDLDTDLDVLTGGMVDAAVATFENSIVDTGFERQDDDFPTDRSPLRIYPNPIRSSATIELDVTVPAEVSLKAFDSGGRFVRSLHSGWLPAGIHEVTMDARDLSSGLYLVRMVVGGTVASHNVIVVR